MLNFVKVYRYRPDPRLEVEDYRGLWDVPRGNYNLKVISWKNYGQTTPERPVFFSSPTKIKEQVTQNNTPVKEKTHKEDERPVLSKCPTKIEKQVVRNNTAVKDKPHEEDERPRTPQIRLRTKHKSKTSKKLHRKRKKIRRRKNKSEINGLKR